LAVVPAVAAVIIAACAAWWLAALLAIPAVLLVVWLLPPLRRVRFQAASWPSSGTGSDATTLRLRLFTLNARGGAADSAVILRILQQYEVDVLAVQDLTPPMVTRLAAAGLTRVLQFSHLDLPSGGRGVGLWARWPLTPLPPVPGLAFAAPRARIDPLGGLPVTLAAVHPVAPVRGHAGAWRRELALIQQTLATVDGPQWWPGISTPPEITGRSEISWQQASWIAQTPARADPGQDSPGRPTGGCYPSCG
jgi:hypothetical protein